MSTATGRRAPGRYPSLAERVLRGRARRYLLFLGGMCVAFGVVALAAPAPDASAESSNSGAGTLVWGLIFLAPIVWLWRTRRNRRRSDLLGAASLAKALRAGSLPAPVPPERLEQSGPVLEASEVCYVAEAPAELALFYGKPTVVRRYGLFAWGGPLAIALSMIVTLGSLDRARRKAKAAAPRWRDPEPVELWITSQRIILRHRGGQWWQLPYERLTSFDLDSDGLVLTGASGECPLKVRTPNAAWAFVLCRRLAGNVVDDVQLPVTLRRAELVPSVVYPG